MKTIKFKCSHCGYTWTKDYSDATAVSSMQKCPKCFKYSENAIDQGGSVWTKMLEKTGKKVEFEKK